MTELPELPCPVCARPSILYQPLDRFLHLDGSSNVECWHALTSGRHTASGTTMSDFLHLRRSWLRVETIDRGNDAWDVALVIDGTYFGEAFATKADIVEFFTDWLSEELNPTIRCAGCGRSFHCNATFVTFDRINYLCVPCTENAAVMDRYDPPRARCDVDG